MEDKKEGRVDQNQSTTPVVTMESMQKPIKGPEKPKAVTPWLFLVFIIVVLAGISFFSWNYFQNKKTVTTVNPVAKVETKVTPPVISSADWKKYTNEQYGYSVKYPAEWVTETTDKCTPSTTTSEYVCSQYIASYKYAQMSGQDMVQANPKDSPNGAIISIVTFSNPKNLSLSDYVLSKDGLNNADSKLQKITINENEFLKETIDGVSSYYLAKGSDVFWFSEYLFNQNYVAMPEVDSVGFQTVFDVVISTLSFKK